ncbi:hypothetical protein KSF_048370 [Reticulibacter mediterranei]|uniref:Uncharacterized protein n=1 Tax=Reticulibacter mediterranei TaxID=2778369 RepID=A0A8J3ING9_9CHLR|nr:hypothetical protein [Reticulibacter mediterranei]GHO94789.1 hypothetical protein KSF_048370 [Reticulibacter mediterranei]
MRHQPSHTTAQKIRNLFPVLAVLLVLYGLASQNYLMLFSIGIGLLILWAAMHPAWIYRLLQQILSSFEKPMPAPPDVQPSQAALEHSLPEQPLYEQGYREQAPGHTNESPKEDSAAIYEDQLQAQYPEQLPPMA